MPNDGGDLAYWATAAFLAVIAALGLAASGVPFLTALGGLRRVKRLKIFLDKYGQQACTFALMSGAAAFLGLAAVGVWLSASGHAAGAFLTALPLPLGPAAGAILVGAALFLAYRGLWQTLKTRKALHALIGFSAGVFFWLALYVLLAAFRARVVGLSPDAATLAAFLVPPAQSLFWPLLPALFCGSLYLAGALGGGYLILRRDVDDFGRDYYNHTLRMSARFALFSGLPAMGLMAVLTALLFPGVEAHAHSLRLTILLAGGLTAGLASLVAYGYLSFQSNCLRLKLPLALATLLTLLAVFGLTAGLTGLFGA